VQPDPGRGRSIDFEEHAKSRVAGWIV